jgi:hypothetical protein
MASETVVPDAVHPRIVELLAYLDRQTDNLRAAFDLVPDERRMVRPAPNRWAPAEIVHHLDIVERRLVQRLSALIEQARSLPPECDAASLFPMERATRIEVRSRRVVTPEVNEPRDTDPDRVWTDYMETREAFKKVVASGDGLSLGDVTAAHPILGEFTAYEWIAFAGAHAARHADQIREMSVGLV